MGGGCGGLGPLCSEVGYVLILQQLTAKVFPWSCDGRPWQRAPPNHRGDTTTTANMATVAPPPSKRQRREEIERTTTQQDVAPLLATDLGSFKANFVDSDGNQMADVIEINFGDATEKNVSTLLNTLLGRVCFPDPSRGIDHPNRKPLGPRRLHPLPLPYPHPGQRRYHRPVSDRFTGAASEARSYQPLRVCLEMLLRYGSLG